MSEVESTALSNAPLLPAAQEEIPQDYKRPPSPQSQTVLSAAVWQAVPQHPD